LIDGCEFVFQLLVKQRYNRFVAFHGAAASFE